MDDGSASDRALQEALAIARARASREWLAESDFPETVEEAHAVAAELSAGEPAALLGGLAGWKCGATNAGAQKKLGLPEPFLGPLFGDTVIESGTTLPFASLGAPKYAFTSEAEFCFVLKQELPPRPEGEQYTEAEVWAAVESVAPAVELVGSRYDVTTSSTPKKVADGALNAAVVVGPRVAAAAVGDPQRLVACAARLLVDGAEVGAGTGADVLGAPLTSLAWLANALPRTLAGQHLRAGDIVMSGAVTASKAFSAGSTVGVSFDGIEAGGGTLTAEVKLL